MKLGELRSVDDVVRELVSLVASPGEADDELHARVRALVERAQRIPRAVRGQELRAYRHELRRMRIEQTMTARQVAAELGWCASKIWRIEQGSAGIRESDMRQLAELYGADAATVDRLVRESRAGWRVGGRRRRGGRRAAGSGQR